MLLSPCAPAAPAVGAATTLAPAQLTPYEVLARAQSVKYYADRALWEIRDNDFGPGRFRKLLAAARHRQVARAAYAAAAAAYHATPRAAAERAVRAAYAAKYGTPIQ
ncbi:hypothetical protein Q5H92_20190 [Hymenobacter sp. M29]|uniref:DUF4398 domain-containing protein n=1 Tax=Hymenobacter mellowenesis TaxID=3063995 RepID=A0ABT9AFN7_9BACT|nr:hypothetical protein [Hymenobacter sp. M29]MDO7848697.1 hypothetical protein [Hymenobacter sp. M29]